MQWLRLQYLAFKSSYCCNSKRFWKQLEEKIYEHVNEKEAAMIVALSVTVYSESAASVYSPLKILEQLDQMHTWSSAGTRISALTYIYSKKCNCGYDMCNSIDEFKFGLLSWMEWRTCQKILDSVELTLLLAKIEAYSTLGNAVSALRLRDISELNWEDVTTDIIEEFKLVGVNHEH